RRAGRDRRPRFGRRPAEAEALAWRVLRTWCEVDGVAPSLVGPERARRDAHHSAQGLAPPALQSLDRGHRTGCTETRRRRCADWRSWFDGILVIVLQLISLRSPMKRFRIAVMGSAIFAAGFLAGQVADSSR